MDSAYVSTTVSTEKTSSLWPFHSLHGQASSSETKDHPEPDQADNLDVEPWSFSSHRAGRNDVGKAESSIGDAEAVFSRKLDASPSGGHRAGCLYSGLDTTFNIRFSLPIEQSNNEVGN